METTTTPDKKQNTISLRLSPEIYEAISKLAKRKTRSMNEQITHLLKLQLGFETDDDNL